MKDIIIIIIIMAWLFGMSFVMTAIANVDVKSCLNETIKACEKNLKNGQSCRIIAVINEVNDNE